LNEDLWLTETDAASILLISKSFDLIELIPKHSIIAKK